MVFKGRFFSSSKKADSSSPDRSSSPRSFGSNSPSGSDKKSVKSTAASLSSSSSRQTEALGKKKGKEPLCTPPSVRKPLDATVTPILASSLGLNKIKTRSGPLPQESSFGFKGSGLGASNLSRTSVKEPLSTGKKKEALKPPSMMSFQENGNVRTLMDSNNFGSTLDSLPAGNVHSRDRSPNVPTQSSLQSDKSSQELGRYTPSRGQSGSSRKSDVFTPEASNDCEIPKESESPRFQAILRVTSAPRKRFPTDVKSFSHELNSKGVRPYPFWKPRGMNNLEEVLVVIRGKFEKAKEEVNSDLAIFAADLVGVLEKNSESHPEWQETIEDLLVLARSCAMTSASEFWLQCESIVQDLDDRRQELPMGMMKQLHTRMLFILTRCTRLLQFHKESGLAEDEHILQLRQSRILHSVDKRMPPRASNDVKSYNALKTSMPSSSRKSYSQEQREADWKKDHVPPGITHTPAAESVKNFDSPAYRNRMSSWKKLPSPAGKHTKDDASVKGEHDDQQVETPKEKSKPKESLDVNLNAVKLSPVKDSNAQPPLPAAFQNKLSWGYWGDQTNMYEDSSIICRICEEEVPTSHVEDHSRICAVADRCDQKGLSVKERLTRIAETLEKMVEICSPKNPKHATDSPDAMKVSNSSVTEDSDLLSPKLSDWSRRGSDDMLDNLPESDIYAFMDDLKSLPSMSCRTRFGLKSDQAMTTSSADSMTPRSPLLTPRTSQIDLLLAGKCVSAEHEDLPQMNELVEIARFAANTPLDDDRSIANLLSSLEDLRLVIERRKLHALTVETFGARIEKLIREKYLQFCELVEDEKVDITSTVIDEDTPLEDDVVRSLRTSPIHTTPKDRTSIDDFEIIKPISRGAFGRVFLAKKRTTGDLFAIKVLKKADMIRKNAVESILAERDILISVRNPFVVRFFYSFTCRENLYLVMEYLNGGDLYSLLRNLGCLEEDVARIYIAEVVLALEYLHSLCVVHRDLKPDNLLIAHDGHIKLTDFGLSRVGLINSTDDLSGPAVSRASLMDEDDPLSGHRRDTRKKRSAVGTSADWWSVGVILFELIVGIPPFNAEHPQTIFDNILNRNIPWPGVPEEMSYEARDLIDRLLTEDPQLRLGANGASEVKEHVFFKDINWDTLARQKAAFVPASENLLDTSYFTSRYSWNQDDQTYAGSEFDDSSDNGSISGSSSCLSNRQDEVGDECGGLAEFESSSPLNYSFSNFSFKNLSQLASINYDLLSKGWKDDQPNNPNV
uniref:non-specific serine/threonine protein kinase n=1 Tax=Kalanchoe fedtschenkoi TaxID=63787 RepID=A0A7N0T7A5_KALFE